jgi:hypothetical protein
MLGKSFSNPKTGEKLCFSAPIFWDFADALEQLSACK